MQEMVGRVRCPIQRPRWEWKVEQGGTGVQRVVLVPHHIYIEEGEEEEEGHTVQADRVVHLLDKMFQVPHSILGREEEEEGIRVVMAVEGAGVRVRIMLAVLVLYRALQVAKVSSFSSG